MGNNILNIMKGKQRQEKARQETLELLPLRCLKHQVITINFDKPIFGNKEDMG
jgi:hypothetical protein